MSRSSGEGRKDRLGLAGLNRDDKTRRTSYGQDKSGGGKGSSSGGKSASNYEEEWEPYDAQAWEGRPGEEWVDDHTIRRKTQYGDWQYGKVPKSKPIKPKGKQTCLGYGAGCYEEKWIPMHFRVRGNQIY